jgi:hypothetical protein
MPATIRGYSTNAYPDAANGSLSIAASSLTPSTASAGDILVAFVNVLNDQPNSSGYFIPTTPTGWTVGLTTTTGASTIDFLVVYTRTATGTSADNFNLTYNLDGSGQIEVTIIAVRDGRNPLFANRVFIYNGNNLSVPSQGTSGDLLLINAATWTGGGASVPFTTVPSGMSTSASQNVNGTNILQTILYSQTSETPSTKTITTNSAGITWANAVSISALPSTFTTSLISSFGGDTFGGGRPYYVFTPLPPVVGANHLYGAFGGNFWGNMEFGGTGTYYDIGNPKINKIGWGFIINSS